MGIALYTLTQIRLVTGQHQQVVQLCRQGLAMSSPAGHGIGHAYLHQHLGLAHQQLGHHIEAIEALTKAANQFQTQRKPHETARALRALADSDQAAGRRQEALHHLQQSIALFHEHGYTRQKNEAQARLATLNGKADSA
jgi:tetratricopeptide (TPR) repeat protein